VLYLLGAYLERGSPRPAPLGPPTTG
jgi:hypothetical protein